MPKPTWNLRAYLELLRLPNVFTAVADVLMGGWLAAAAAGTTLSPGLAALLVGSSSCLYLAGMVWNDYFDRQRDLRERPERPIPSQRVSPAAAWWLGSELMIVGVACALTASTFLGWRPGLVAVALAAAVLAYDGWLKNTWLGPLNMGLCRALNVGLGMSVVAGPWGAVHYVVAAALGLYITGVTAFARQEATTSRPAHLLASLLVMVAAMATLAWSVHLLPAHRLAGQTQVWTLFWIVLGGQIAWRCLQAVAHPQPVLVQRAVKNCLFALIIFDAALTMAVQGWPPAVGILLLLLPAHLLGRWIYST